MIGLRTLACILVLNLTVACADQTASDGNGNTDDQSEDQGTGGGMGQDGGGATGGQSTSKDCEPEIEQFEVIEQLSPSSLRVAYRVVDCEGNPISCVDPEGVLLTSNDSSIVAGNAAFVEQPDRVIALLFDLSDDASNVRDEVMAATYAIVDEVFAEDPEGRRTTMIALPLGDNLVFEWIDREQTAAEFKAAIDLTAESGEFTQRDLYRAVQAAHDSIALANLPIPGERSVLVVTAGDQDETVGGEVTLDDIAFSAENSMAELCLFAIPNSYSTGTLASLAPAVEGKAPCFFDDPEVTASPDAIQMALARRWRQGGVLSSEICFSETPGEELTLSVSSNQLSTEANLNLAELQLSSGACDAFAAPEGERIAMCEAPDLTPGENEPHPDVPDVIPACMELIALQYHDENQTICDDGDPAVFEDTPPVPGLISICDCAEPAEADGEWVYEFPNICPASADLPTLLIHVDEVNWDYSLGQLLFDGQDAGKLFDSSEWEYGEGWRREAATLQSPHGERGLSYAFLDRSSCL